MNGQKPQNEVYIPKEISSNVAEDSINKKNTRYQNILQKMLLSEDNSAQEDKQVNNSQGIQGESMAYQQKTSEETKQVKRNNKFSFGQISSTFYEDQPAATAKAIADFWDLH